MMSPLLATSDSVQLKSPGSLTFMVARVLGLVQKVVQPGVQIWKKKNEGGKGEKESLFIVLRWFPWKLGH